MPPISKDMSEIDKCSRIRDDVDEFYDFMPQGGKVEINE